MQIFLYAFDDDNNVLFHMLLETKQQTKYLIIICQYWMIQIHRGQFVCFRVGPTYSGPYLLARKSTSI